MDSMIKEYENTLEQLIKRLSELRGKSLEARSVDAFSLEKRMDTLLQEIWYIKDVLRWLRR